MTGLVLVLLFVMAANQVQVYEPDVLVIGAETRGMVVIDTAWATGVSEELGRYPLLVWRGLNKSRKLARKPGRSRCRPPMKTDMRPG